MVHNSYSLLSRSRLNAQGILASWDSKKSAEWTPQKFLHVGFQCLPCLRQPDIPSSPIAMGVCLSDREYGVYQLHGSYDQLQVWMLLCRETMHLEVPEALSVSLGHWDYIHQMHCLVNFPLVPWERVCLNKPIWFSHCNDCNSIFLNLSFKWCVWSPSIFKESSPQAFLRRWTHCIIKPVVFRMWFRILAHVRRHLPHTALSHYWKSMK